MITVTDARAFYLERRPWIPLERIALPRPAARCFHRISSSSRFPYPPRFVIFSGTAYGNSIQNESEDSNASIRMDFERELQSSLPPLRPLHELSKPFSMKGCTLFVITETPPRSLPLRKLMHIGEKSMNETRVCHDNRGLLYLSGQISTISHRMRESSNDVQRFITFSRRRVHDRSQLSTSSGVYSRVGRIFHPRHLTSTLSSRVNAGSDVKHFNMEGKTNLGAHKGEYIPFPPP